MVKRFYTICDLFFVFLSAYDTSWIILHFFFLILLLSLSFTIYFWLSSSFSNLIKEKSSWVEVDDVNSPNYGIIGIYLSFGF